MKVPVPTAVVPRRRIYTIWPATVDGLPGGSWSQSKRWLVLDMTNGHDRAEIVAGPMPRLEACAAELRLRADGLVAPLGLVSP